MLGIIISGTYGNEIVLSNPASQNPVSITSTGLIAPATGDGVLGQSGFAWTVSNAGKVAPAGGVGIHLKSGGAVTNTGTVLASFSGAVSVEIDGTAGVVANIGTITGKVVLGAGGTIENGNASSAAALIGGDTYLNGSASATNFGTISSLVLNGTGDSVTNASATAQLGAVRAQGDAGVILNRGTIGVVFAWYPTGSNIAVSNYGSILGIDLNSGSGTGLKGTIVNAPGALIQGAISVYTYLSSRHPMRTAALADFNGGVVMNSGTVRNTGTFFPGIGYSVRGTYGVGVSLTGTVINAASGLIAGPSGAAVSGSVVNYGTIAGAADYGLRLTGAGSLVNGAGSDTAATVAGGLTGLQLAGSTLASVTNFGTISGATGISAGYSGTAPLTIDNFGLIAGTAGTALSFDAGAGLLKLETGWRLSGALANFGALDTIDLAGQATTSLVYSGTTAGGTLTVLDGAATVAAIGFAGDFTHSRFGNSSDGAGGTDIALAQPGAAVGPGSSSPAPTVTRSSFPTRRRRTRFRSPRRV